MNLTVEIADILRQFVDRGGLLNSTVRERLRAVCDLSRATVHLFCRLGNIPHNVEQTAADLVQIFQQFAEFTEIIACVKFRVNGKIFIRHFSEYSPDIVHCIFQICAQQIGRFCDVTDFIISDSKFFNFYGVIKLNVSKSVDCIFNGFYRTNRTPYYHINNNRKNKRTADAD